MSINSICDKVYVVSLPHRLDRREHAIEQGKKFNFEFEFFDAINGDEIFNFTGLRNGENALLQSYLSLLHKIKEDTSLNEILIMEDDFEFVEDVNARLANEIGSIPADCDLLYLGMNRSSLGAGFIPPQQINDHVIKIFSSFGAHAIVITRRMIDPIIEKIKMFDKPLDVMYVELQQQYNAYGFAKNLCVQYDSHSDIIKFNPGYRAAGIFD